MKRNFRTLSAAVFAAVLILAVSGCKKKTPVAPPPPPPPAKTEAPPPPSTPPAVRINSFTAEPSSIEQGQSATLRWSVANATDISIDQGLGQVAANGSRQVFPSNTVTYTLTARGAGGSDTRSVTVEVSAPPPPPPPPPVKETISGADMLSREAQDIYFDYDKSDLREDARAALQHDAELLKRIFAADPNFMVVIEGNCDERGSAEYNLGLGDRRATAAKEFLVQLGLPADRISTISYGKDRPVCTEANEACYQRNRRDHLAPAK
ncbi:MAG TPA: OmpA family protein [Bryobacteraceae bacterium]|jgi:peptidoglycan-associated lipoprotein|nr:OmpA family protein [Bryobacteraceae bacterium]